jgi:hypothetical protein
MNRCEEMQRLWLLGEEGTLGWLGRRTFARHLAGCADCRSFAADAGALTRLAARAMEIDPPAAVLRSLTDRATALLPVAVESGVSAEQRWWAGAFTGGALLAAAAGLVLAVLRPTAFSGHPTPPSRLEARLAWAQQELDQLGAEPPARPGRVTIDDRIHSLERQLRCLDSDVENVNWNTLKAGASCADS